MTWGIDPRIRISCQLIHIVAWLKLSMVEAPLFASQMSKRQGLIKDGSTHTSKW
eukprot:CAMPEP_0114547634 /NCGR_PEP_ID=MMETSP0114-20121206/4564_1 /TAXON_ID=31324 /ORGANISM="Goniomonas sp, Strain m" /LENGTH=53 /DNA_ID=CAMNT_0001732193 /DNA_START=173 /DNA_END=334 /DNA_ORIENTATION=+